MSPITIDWKLGQELNILCISLLATFIRIFFSLCKRLFSAHFSPRPMMHGKRKHLSFYCSILSNSIISPVSIFSFTIPQERYFPNTPRGILKFFTMPQERHFHNIWTLKSAPGNFTSHSRIRRLNIFCSRTSWRRSLCWQPPAGEGLDGTSGSSLDLLQKIVDIYKINFLG